MIWKGRITHYTSTILLQCHVDISLFPQISFWENELCWTQKCIYNKRNLIQLPLANKGHVYNMTFRCPSINSLLLLSGLCFSPLSNPLIRPLYHRCLERRDVVTFARHPCQVLLQPCCDIHTGEFCTGTKCAEFDWERMVSFDFWEHVIPVHIALY